MQACLVHTEEIAQGAVGDPLLALEERRHRPQHRVELTLSLSWRVRVERHSGGGARPYHAAPRIVANLRVGIEQCLGEIVQGVIIQLKLPLEGAIRQAAPLAQERDHLIQDRDKVHPRLLPVCCGAGVRMISRIIA